MMYSFFPHQQQLAEAQYIVEVVAVVVVVVVVVTGYYGN